MWRENWQAAEVEWDHKSKEAAKKQPIKKLHILPQMEGITNETRKNLKWKSFKWMALQDHKLEVTRGFFKHPFKYIWNYLKSLFKPKSYIRKGDFFLYNFSSIDEFKQALKNTHNLLILGFSYCHKPFECPSGRFTDKCENNAENLVCQQCFIGKALKSAEGAEVIPLIIPTVHYIGGKVFEIRHAHPRKDLLFIITACEMTLEMFGDWGNMAGIKGVGVRLDGRICNTMKAFELSEKGIKPGLTVVLDDTQIKIMDLIRTRSASCKK